MAKRTYTLKACSTSTGTANASATVNVPRSGRIVAIESFATGTGGAGVDGRVLFELSAQSVSTAASNDTVNLGMAHIALSSNIASSATSQNSCSTGMSIPIEAGARLYINQLASGTAFASIITAFTIHVEES